MKLGEQKQRCFPTTYAQNLLVQQIVLVYGVLACLPDLSTAAALARSYCRVNPSGRLSTSSVAGWAGKKILLEFQNTLAHAQSQKTAMLTNGHRQKAKEN